MIHPNAIRTKQPTDLGDKRSTSAVADQVNGQLSQRMSGPFRNEIGIKKTRDDCSRNLVSAIGIVSELAPVQFDYDFRRIRVTWCLARQSAPCQDVAVVQQ